MRKSLWLIVASMLMLVGATAGFGKTEKDPNQNYVKWQKVGQRSTPPGYHLLNNELDEIVFTETFDAGTLPTGWEIVDLTDNGVVTWNIVSGACDANQHDTCLEANAPYAYVDADEDGARGGHYNAALVMPELQVEQGGNYVLRFDYRYKKVNGQDSLSVEVSTDAGTTWQLAREMDGTTGLELGEVLLSEFAENSTSLKIRFRYGSGWNWYAGIDNIEIETGDDLVDPFVDVVEMPSGFRYTYDETVKVIADVADDGTLSSVLAKYGVWHSGVANVLEAAMSVNDDGNYECALDLSSFSHLDTIGVSIEATDNYGHMTRNPEDVEQWYGFIVFTREGQPYEYIDADYEWLDISTTGTQLESDDDEVYPFSLTDLGVESFTYFDVEYDSIFISTNGWFSFTTNGTSSYASPSSSFPYSGRPNTHVALFQCDMNNEYDESGQIYYEVVDGHLVVSYDNVCIYGQHDKFLSMQAVLYPESGQVLCTYKDVDVANAPEYDRSHLVGFENQDGSAGDYLYLGREFGVPGDETAYLLTMPVGVVAGSIYESDGTTGIAGADVILCEDDTYNVVRAVVSNDDGAYEMTGVFEGTYDLAIRKNGFVSQRIEDIVVVSQQETNQDVSLEVETNVTDIIGDVRDADATGGITPVEGVTIRLVEFDETVTTDAEGHFTFGSHLVGFYTIEINNDFGLTTYHKQTLSFQAMTDMGSLVIGLKQILAPTNVVARPGEGAATIVFDEPANQMEMTVLVERIEELRSYRNAHLTGDKTFENFAEICERLSFLENVYERRQNVDELNSTDDFLGYRVKVDGTLTDDLYESSPISISELENFVEHTFNVAADYGYGDENLVFSEEVTATPTIVQYQIYSNIYEWVEIRTNDLGTACGFVSDDRGTGLMDIGEGAVFSFYGTNYDQLNLCSNGVIIFENRSSYMISDVTIPSDSSPHGCIAPLSDYMETSDSDDYDVWYYYDAENEKFIATWHVAEWFVTPVNVLEFQVVLNLSDNTIVFNYKNAGSHWPGDVAGGGDENDGTIGIEKPNDLEGVVYVDAEGNELQASNELSIKFAEPAYGTISGSVIDCEDNIVVGAEIKEGDTVVAVTGEDGTFSAEDVLVGSHTYTILKTGFVPVTVTVVVEEEQNTEIPVVEMYFPGLAVDPTAISLTYDLGTGQAVSESFEISNDGCGPLDYTITTSVISGFDRLRNGERPVVASSNVETKHASFTPVGPVVNSLDATWDNVFGFEASAITQNARLFGVGHTAAGFHLLSWSPDDNPEVNHWYNVSSDGTTLEGTLDFTGMTDFGNDLGYDPFNGVFYGISNGGMLYRFNPDLSEVTPVHQFPTNVMLVPCTYDWDNQLIYTFDWNGSNTFFSYNMQTEENEVLTSPPSGTCALNSLTYVPCDEEGYTIYGLFYYGYHDGTNEMSKLHRYNPSTNSWEETGTDIPDMHSPGGFNVTTSFQEGRLDFVTLAQNNVDQALVSKLEVWEGFAFNASNWFSLSGTSGSLEAGTAQTITFTVDPEDLNDFPYVDGDEVQVAIRVNGDYVNEEIVIATIDFTGVGTEESSVLPMKYALYQNYPNPFNPSTEIKFDLVEGQNVKLTVYNMLGQEVMTLVDGRMEAGYQKVSFNGASLASGVYFYRLEAEHFTSLKKMVLVK